MKQTQTAEEGNDHVHSTPLVAKAKRWLTEGHPNALPYLHWKPKHRNVNRAARFTDPVPGNHGHIPPEPKGHSSSRE